MNCDRFLKFIRWYFKQSLHCDLIQTHSFQIEQYKLDEIFGFSDRYKSEEIFRDGYRELNNKLSFY